MLERPPAAEVLPLAQTIDPAPSAKAVLRNISVKRLWGSGQSVPRGATRPTAKVSEGETTKRGTWISPFRRPRIAGSRVCPTCKDAIALILLTACRNVNQIARSHPSPSGSDAQEGCSDSLDFQSLGADSTLPGQPFVLTQPGGSPILSPLTAPARDCPVLGPRTNDTGSGACPYEPELVLANDPAANDRQQ